MVISTIGIPPSQTASAAMRASHADDARTTGTTPISTIRSRTCCLSIFPPPRETCPCRHRAIRAPTPFIDRKSTRLNSSHGYISYAVFCLKKKKPRGPDAVHVRSPMPSLARLVLPAGPAPIEEHLRSVRVAIGLLVDLALRPADVCMLFVVSSPTSLHTPQTASTPCAGTPYSFSASANAWALAFILACPCCIR